MGGDAIPVIKKRRLSFLFCNIYIVKTFFYFRGITKKLENFLLEYRNANYDTIL